jgi:hypothetical protein
MHRYTTVALTTDFMNLSLFFQKFTALNHIMILTNLPGLTGTQWVTDGIDM